MKYLKILSIVGLLCMSSMAHAQVFVRLPFVRVYADGPYWSVRAPFVNIGSVDYPPAPLVGPILPPPITEIRPVPAAATTLPEIANAQTLNDFAKTFSAKPGNYAANLINPVSGQPTHVNFTLPQESVNRVLVNNDNLVFDYGPRHYVKIEFDRDGATVISR